MRNSPQPKRKKMNKWLLGFLIFFALLGSLMIYGGYKAKKGMDFLNAAMKSTNDEDIARFCLKAETDPATKQNLDRLKNATPSSMQMLKKISPEIYNVNVRQLKICASDYKAILKKAKTDKLQKPGK